MDLSSPSRLFRRLPRARAALLTGLLRVSVSLLISSCAMVRPNLTPETPVGGEIPARWNGAPVTRPLDQAGLSRWWKKFQDPSMTRLIEEALRSSPDIRTALSRVSESRASLAGTTSGLFPNLTAGASTRQSQTNNQDTGRQVSSQSWGGSLDASWEIDLFGKLRHNILAADAAVGEAEENFFGSQVTLAAEVAEAYISLRQAQAQLKVTEESLNLRGDTTQIAEWKEQAGLASSLDTMQSSTSLDQARAAIPQLKQTITQTKHRLALLCGKNPGAIHGLLTESASFPSAPATIAAGIPAEALRNRPDVRAAERAIAQAVALREAAVRERLPSLNLSGSIGFDALKAGDLFSPQQIVSSLLAGLTTPVFDAGRIDSAIKVQQEREKQAVYAYEKVVLTALSEVEDALTAISRSTERLAVLVSAEKSARSAATIASQQFQVGRQDMLTVLEAQRTLLSVEEQITSTRADILSAHIQLYKALGGGWN